MQDGDSVTNAIFTTQRLMAAIKHAYMYAPELMPQFINHATAPSLSREGRIAYHYQENTDQWRKYDVIYARGDPNSYRTV